MATITVKDGKSFEASAEERLVVALEDNGVDILHRCGGYAGCTTCRVVIHEGEPTKITQAELDKLQENDKLGEFRLSCQILCEGDMTVEPLMLLSETELDSAGNRPKDHITPDPVEWVEKPSE